MAEYGEVSGVGSSLLRESLMDSTGVKVQKGPPLDAVISSYILLLGCWGYLVGCVYLFPLPGAEIISPWSLLLSSVCFVIGGTMDLYRSASFGSTCSFFGCWFFLAGAVLFWPSVSPIYWPLIQMTAGDIGTWAWRVGSFVFAMSSVSALHTMLFHKPTTSPSSFSRENYSDTEDPPDAPGVVLEHDEIAAYTVVSAESSSLQIESIRVDPADVNRLCCFTYKQQYIRAIFGCISYLLGAILFTSGGVLFATADTIGIWCWIVGSCGFITGSSLFTHTLHYPDWHKPPAKTSYQFDLTV